MTFSTTLFVLALAHSLWIGVAIALGVAVVLKLLPDSASGLRSFFCASAIYVLFAAFLLIYIAISPERSDLFHVGTSQSYAPFLNAIFVLWTAGMATMVARIGRDWLTGVNAVKRSSILADPGMSVIVKRFAGKLGVSRSIRVRHTNHGASLCSFGLLRPVILTPAACIAHLSPDELEAVLAHEVAHIARLDFLHACLISIIRAILFFNPALHWLYAAYQAEAEKACDDLAVSIIASPEPLASGLLRLGMAAVNPPAVAATGHEMVGSASLRLRAERLLGYKTNLAAPRSRIAFTAANLAIATAAVLAVFMTATVAKPDMMSEQKLVQLKTALCTVLEDDNIFGNPEYDPGGPATLLAVSSSDTVTMNGKILPSSTAKAVKGLFAAYHVDYGDITHMRYLGRDIRLTVKSRLTNNSRRAIIYQTQSTAPGIKISRRHVQRQNS